MQAIGAAVDNINSLETNMAPLLIDLGRVHGRSGMFDPKYFELFKVSKMHKIHDSFVIDREAREIIYLVASVRLSICVLSHGKTI